MNKLASNGVSTPDWEKWQTLTEDQRQFELHRILQMLDTRTQGLDTRMESIERSVRVHSFTGGVIGGIITVLSFIGIQIGTK